MKETLKKMKTSKTLGPDDIPIEVWRCLEDVVVVWLTKLFNSIFYPIRCLMSGEKIYFSTNHQE
jgi:hypothetical protein